MDEIIKISKIGSLRFWGDWFGRPMDNCHIVKSTFLKKEENELHIVFHEDELCIIVNPVNVVSNEKQFYVKYADRIIWQWFYYGRAKIADSLCIDEYELQKGGYVKITQNELSRKICIKPTLIKSKKNFAMEIC